MGAARLLPSLFNKYLFVWTIRFLKAQTGMSVPPMLSSGIRMPGNARLLPNLMMRRLLTPLGVQGWRGEKLGLTSYCAHCGSVARPLLARL
jgi:hypothetical protein